MAGAAAGLEAPAPAGAPEGTEAVGMLKHMLAAAVGAAVIGSDEAAGLAVWRCLRLFLSGRATLSTVKWAACDCCTDWYCCLAALL